jgi:hypothetical protein
VLVTGKAGEASRNLSRFNQAVPEVLSPSTIATAILAVTESLIPSGRINPESSGFERIDVDILPRNRIASFVLF